MLSLSLQCILNVFVMRRFLFMLVVSGIVLSACSSGSNPEQQAENPLFENETHQAFFNNLASLCGNTYQGEQIYRSHHSSGWAHLDLIMKVSVCEEGQILIPFQVGEDHSRTWMFISEEGRLRFRHDHRHPDGTPEDDTLYGGYADLNGSAFVQHFPADEYTGTIIEGGSGNIWTVSISEDFTTFSYWLERDGEKRLRIDFDLTKPL